MKSVIAFAIALFIFTGMGFSQESVVGTVLGGQHRLGKSGVLASVLVPDLTNTISNSANSYFVFVARKEGMFVVFTWKKDNEYVISELPITKVRVRYDEEVENPYVIFKWVKGDQNKIQPIMDNFVIYAIFVCKSDVWNPSNVSTNVPLQKPIELEKKDVSLKMEDITDYLACNSYKSTMCMYLDTYLTLQGR